MSKWRCDSHTYCQCSDTVAARAAKMRLFLSFDVEKDDIAAGVEADIVTM